LEDGVGDLDLDEEGAAVDKKKHTPAQRTLNDFSTLKEPLA